MEVKTVVINESNIDLKLKEGNGGVYRNLCALRAKIGKYTIECNVNATYREYWVGTGLQGEDDAVVTITSDDCAENETIKIVNDPGDSRKLKLEYVSRGSKETKVVNRTGGVIKVCKNGAELVGELKTDEALTINPKDRCEYEVEAGPNNTIPILAKDVDKNQKIVIFSDSNQTSTPKLDTIMVPRRVLLTTIVNNTNAPISVKYDDVGDSNSGGKVLKELKAKEDYTIEYDPKKGHKYWVEYRLTSGATSRDITQDVAEFETINVKNSPTTATQGTIDFERLNPRSSPGIIKSAVSGVSRWWHGLFK